MHAAARRDEIGTDQVPGELLPDDLERQRREDTDHFQLRGLKPEELEHLRRELVVGVALCRVGTAARALAAAKLKAVEDEQARRRAAEQDRNDYQAARG